MAGEPRALRLTPPSERNNERRGRWLLLNKAGGLWIACVGGAYGGVGYTLVFLACFSISLDTGVGGMGMTARLTVAGPHANVRAAPRAQLGRLRLRYLLHICVYVRVFIGSACAGL